MLATPSKAVAAKALKVIRVATWGSADTLDMVFFSSVVGLVNGETISSKFEQIKISKISKKVLVNKLHKLVGTQAVINTIDSDE